jgi:aminoglycoside 3-N-acetyltransferase
MNKDYYDKMLHQLDIHKGDILLVSSDIRKLILACMRQGEKFDVNLFLDSLINAVGEAGTLLLPTYNWDFCKGITFDYYKTPSQTGALGAAALERGDFKRSKHPIYSFAIWGKDKEELCQKDYKSSFGEDSIFAYLYQKKGKDLVIDTPIGDCCTFAHYVEETSGLVSYRYKKSFTAGYIDEDKKETKRAYEMFVRNLDLDVENIGPSEEDFLEAGAGCAKDVNGSHFFVMDFEKAYQMIYQDIKYNKSRKICRFKGQ